MSKLLPRSRPRLFLAILVLAAVFGTRPGWAFQITSFGFNPSGGFEVQFGPTDASHYYVLFRGTTVTNLASPMSLAFGSGASGQLADTNPPGPAGIYRVLEVATNNPVDVDADGIDDVYEMLHPSFLNPLDGTDAAWDQDADGFSNLQEYLWGTDPVNLDPFPRQRLVINEVDYDNISNPDSTEFVELFNGSPRALNMNGRALVFINGANNAEYGRVELSGYLAPGQYYVVASTNLTLPLGALMTPLPTSTNDLQNGAPDGIALIQVWTHTLIDSLAYEGGITAAVINGATGTYNLVEGTALSASVADSNTGTGSLIRNANGMDTGNDNSDWTFTSTPTPGATNVFSP